MCILNCLANPVVLVGTGLSAFGLFGWNWNFLHLRDMAGPGHIWRPVTSSNLEDLDSDTLKVHMWWFYCLFPFFRFPSLFPPLKPETVARRTVEAVQMNQAFLLLPWTMHVLVILKRWVFPLPSSSLAMWGGLALCLFPEAKLRLAGTALSSLPLKDSHGSKRETLSEVPFVDVSSLYNPFSNQFHSQNLDSWGINWIFV